MASRHPGSTLNRLGIDKIEHGSGAVINVTYTIQAIDHHGVRTVPNDHIDMIRDHVMQAIEDRESRSAVV